jgi:hypothetical protein
VSIWYVTFQFDADDLDKAEDLAADLKTMVDQHPVTPRWSSLKRIEEKLVTQAEPVMSYNELKSYREARGINR